MNPPEFEDVPRPDVDIPEIPDTAATTEDLSISLHPPQTDPACNQTEVTESETVRVSEGEIVMQVLESSEEGEVSASGELTITAPNGEQVQGEVPAAGEDNIPADDGGDE